MMPGSDGFGDVVIYVLACVYVAVCGGIPGTELELRFPFTREAG